MIWIFCRWSRSVARNNTQKSLHSVKPRLFTYKVYVLNFYFLYFATDFLAFQWNKKWYRKKKKHSQKSLPFFFLTVCSYSRSQTHTTTPTEGKFVSKAFTKMRSLSNLSSLCLDICVQFSFFGILVILHIWSVRVANISKFDRIKFK